MRRETASKSPSSSSRERGSTKRPTYAGALAWKRPKLALPIGVTGLETSCEVIFVVRRDHHALRLYAHVGTGNYRAGAERPYDDAGCARDELIGWITGAAWSEVNRHDSRRVCTAVIKLRQ